MRIYLDGNTIGRECIALTLTASDPTAYQANIGKRSVESYLGCSSRESTVVPSAALTV